MGVTADSFHSFPAGTVFGADDFLPCLTWVLLRSDAVTLQIDTDYMMELLDPTQLQGEGNSPAMQRLPIAEIRIIMIIFMPTGGYYLTTLYASLYYISSFRPRLAARQLSVEAQKSLNQWHRRRTLYCNQSRRSNHRRTIRKHACHSSRMKAGNKDEHGARHSEQEHGRERNYEGKPGLEDEGVRPALEKEPGSKEEILSQSSEEESVVKEEDGAEVAERELLNKEEAGVQS